MLLKKLLIVSLFLIPSIVLAVFIPEQGGTGIDIYTAGDLIYAQTSTFLNKLNIGSTGQFLTVSGGIPAWGDAVDLTTDQSIGGVKTFTGSLMGVSSFCDNDLSFCTRGYTDLKSIEASVRNVKAVVTSNLSATYNNGLSGAGANLVGTSNGAFPTTDGVTLYEGDRVLVTAQTDPIENGIYEISSPGDGSSPYLITRTTDFNKYSNILVTDGTIYENSLWRVTPIDGDIEYGSSIIEITKLNSAIVGLKQTYGTAQTGATQTFATSSDTNIGLNITTGTNSHTFTPTWTGILGASRGGTGRSSFSDWAVLYGYGNEIAQVVPAATGNVLISRTEDSPTWGKVGLTTHVSGTLPVANGGTGAATWGQGWLHSSGGTTALTSSTSPTVNYITATSTTATNYFAGKVGVGTAIPASKLEVNGQGAGGTTTIRIDTGSTDQDTALEFWDDGQMGLKLFSDKQIGGDGIVSQSDFSIKTSGGTSIFSATTGNLGIGTLTPAYKLDVSGLGRFTGLVDASHFVATSSSATSTLKDTSVSGRLSVVQPTTNALIIGNTTGNTRGSYAVDIQSTRSGATQVAGGGASNLAIGSNNTASAASGYSSAIGYGNTASGRFYNTAVGANNSVLSDVASVLGYSTAVGYNNSIASTAYYSGALGYTNNITSSGVGYAVGYNNSVSGASSYAFGAGITNDVGSSLMIGPANTAKLTILTTGKMGVGTTTPASNFDMYYGVAANTGTYVGASSDLKFSGTTGVPIGKGFYSQVYSADDVDAVIYGVHGKTDTGNTAYGVYGEAVNGDTEYGVYGTATGNAGTFSATGVYGNASGGTTNWAGYFNGGNVYIANNLGLGITPTTRLHINEPSATSTAYISSGSAGKGGRLILEDVDGAGCTEVTALNGVLAAKIVTCP